MATCQYLYNNLDVYHKNHEDLAVAAFGGVAIPTVTVYIGGFQRGIEFFNQKVLMSAIGTYPTFEGGGPWFYFNGAPGRDAPSYNKARYDTFVKLLEASKYKDEIEEIKNDPTLKTSVEKVIQYRKLYEQKMYDEFSIKMIKLGDYDTHFTGTFTAGDAIGITKQYLNRGASAIIAVAGPQSLDAAQEIQNQNSKAFVIGVDSAMEDGDYQRYHRGCGPDTKGQRIESDPYVDRSVLDDGSFSEEANAIIKFSGVKDLRSVANKVTRLCAEGKNWDINADPWEHDHVSDWTTDDTHVLCEDDVDYAASDSDSKVTINSLNSPLPENIKKLVVPTKWISKTLQTEQTYEKIDFAANCFANKINNIEEIRFDCPELSFGSDSFKMSNDSKIKYLEFTSLEQVDNINFASSSVFTNWPKSENGILGFMSPLINTNQKRLIKQAISNAGIDHWYQVKPSPYKSVCSTGFQTCSNILNGLISISWDGFIPMMQALNHLNFNMIGYAPQLTLEQAWQEAALWYFDELPDQIKDSIPEEYIDSVKDGLSFVTYNKKYTEDDEFGHKKGEPTIYYKNYNHTMGILGKLLDSAQMIFDRNMSLVPDGHGSFKIMDENAKSMTILDWLDCNMYMMS